MYWLVVIQWPLHLGWILYTAQMTVTYSVTSYSALNWQCGPQGGLSWSRVIFDISVKFELTRTLWAVNWHITHKLFFLGKKLLHSCCSNMREMNGLIWSCYTMRLIACYVVPLHCRCVDVLERAMRSRESVAMQTLPKILDTYGLPQRYVPMFTFLAEQLRNTESNSLAVCRGQWNQIGLDISNVSAWTCTIKLCVVINISSLQMRCHPHSLASHLSTSSLPIKHPLAWPVCQWCH